MSDLKKYKVTNQFTGESLIVEREKPPSTTEIDSIFASPAPKTPPPAIPPMAEPEKKLGYWGRVAQPIKDLPGKYVESYNAAKNAPVTPGAEIPAAIGRAGGVVAEGLLNPIGAGLSSLNQLAGGVPGKILEAPIKYPAQIGTSAGVDKLGGWFANTDAGKNLYKFGTDPEQAQNLRALGATSSFLGLGAGKKAVAEAAEKGVFKQKLPAAVIKATTKSPNTEALYRKLPKAYAEGSATTTEGIKDLSTKLTEYGLEKHVDPLHFNPRKLENEAQDLYSSAVKRADERLHVDAKSGMTKAKKVDIMEAFDEAIMEEIDKGTKGILSDEFPSAFDRVKSLRDVYAKEWSGKVPVEKALDFRRNVLKNKQNLFKNSVEVTPEGQIDAEIKKLVYHKLNEKFADISPDFKKFNGMANDLKSIKDAAEGMRSKSGLTLDLTTPTNEIQKAVLRGVQKTFTSDIPLTNQVAAGIGNANIPGNPSWSLKDLVTKGQLNRVEAPKYGVPYSAEKISEITSPVYKNYGNAKKLKNKGTLRSIYTPTGEAQEFIIPKKKGGK
jgi:hypothetical protein